MEQPVVDIARFVDPSPYTGRVLCRDDNGQISIEGLGPVADASIPALFSDASLIWTSSEWREWATQYATYCRVQGGSSSPVGAEQGSHAIRAPGTRRPWAPYAVVTTFFGIVILLGLLSQANQGVVRSDAVVTYPDGSVMSVADSQYRDKLASVLVQLRGAYRVFGSPDSLDDALTGAQAFELIYMDMQTVTPPSSYGREHAALMSALKKSADGSTMLHTGLDDGDRQTAKTGGQMVIDGYGEAIAVLSDMGM